MYVCLWSPGWSTAGASAADGGGGGGSGGGSGRAGGGDDPLSSYDLAPLLAELAPRLRVEREVIWADGRGLDASALARRLLERLAGAGVTARVGVAAVPVTAELAARWGPQAGAEADGPTPFLVKERTGWGRRRGSGGKKVDGEKIAASEEGALKEESTSDDKAAHPPSPSRCREGAEAGAEDGIPGTRDRNGAGIPPSGGVVAKGGSVVVVEKGREVEWQGGLPVSALRPDTRLEALLDGVGIRTVGQLAELEGEAVEVRFGGKAVALWRVARADDRRLLFDRISPERPHGSLDFVDYVLTDPARLLFTANALLTPLCEGLADRGEHARTLRLVLPLANSEAWERTIRPARPTASQETWLRLIRGLLEKITVPDAVSGMRIEVPTTEAAAVRQGDLFDRGFATASAVEAAVARLAERQLWPVTPETDGHPRVERRGEWKRRSISRSISRSSSSSSSSSRGLALQLLESPRRLTVETIRRRDHEAPARIRDRGGWRNVLHATGPDRISGGQWEGSAYAREYYRCVTGEGVPLWVYRDALEGGWYLHGWWD